MKMEHAENFEASDEAELVAAATADPTSFVPLYERYVDQVYHYAYESVGNHPDAEDVTSQIFQQALGALPDYESRDEPFSAWLYRIAQEVVSGRRRSERHEAGQGVMTTEADGEPDGLTTFDFEQLAGEVMAALRALPPDEQRVIVLRFSRGLTSREIGELTGCDEGAVKKRLHGAMVSLQIAFENSTHV